MDKRLAGSILSRLEKAADELQSHLASEELSPAAKADLKSIVGHIDQLSDKVEVTAFGEESFKKRQAKVLEKDSDEKYMDTFDNPQKVIESDPDEPYMHDTGPTFQGKGVKTFDSDDTSQVTDRDEYAVRELNEWASGTKKQPSWSKGPAGKSTAWG
jgi:hypothetical protein